MVTCAARCSRWGTCAGLGSAVGLAKSLEKRQHLPIASGCLMRFPCQPPLRSAVWRRLLWQHAGAHATIATACVLTSVAVRISRPAVRRRWARHHAAAGGGRHDAHAQDHRQPGNGGGRHAGKQLVG